MRDFFAKEALFAVVGLASSKLSAAQDLSATAVSPTIVGVVNLQPICDEGAASAGGDAASWCAVADRITTAMEKDGLLKLAGIDRGELDCPSLQSAENGAERLSFEVSSTEVVTAERVSHSTWDASAYTDKQSRMGWTGVVLEGENYSRIPRTISMTWSGCDVETFALRVINPMYDGTTSAIESLPCEISDGGNGVCMLHIVRQDEQEGQAAIELTGGDTSTIEESVSSLSSSDDEVQDGESSAQQSSDPSSEVGTGENRRFLRHSDEPLSSAENSPHRLLTNNNEHGDAMVTETLPAEYSSGEPSRHFPGVSDLREQNPKRDTTASEARRHLEEIASAGMAAAHAQDLDLRAKDDDIHILNEYLLASPHEQETFHNKGLRRLNSEEVVMPSGRVLATTNTIDILVLYTTKARIETNDENGPMRSTAQMESELTTAYQGSNDAFLDSGVNIAVNIVGMQSIDYNEGSSMTDAVFALYEGTGQLSGVPQMREDYGADLVQLVGFYTDSCGVAFTMKIASVAFAKYGYSVVHTNCLLNYSHTHEIAHNLGANHDRDNSATESEYAHGYRYCDGQDSYRTIMAYASGCLSAPRVNVFSTPTLLYDGRPQGTATDDNVRALNLAAAVAANFFESKTNIITQQRMQLSPTAAPVSKPTAKPTTKATPIIQGKSKLTTPQPTPAPVPAPTPSSKPTESIYPASISEKFMKRMGCFMDDPNDRVMTAGTKMPAIDGVTAGLTRDNCMAYCHNHETFYKYFGVEYGEECFCWHNNKGYEQLGSLPDSSCDWPCAGEPSRTCGGEDAIEVFKIKNVKHQQQDDLDDLNADEATSQGCYRDTLAELEMANLPVIDHAHATQEACRVHCEDAGFDFYALEFGFMCQCGDVLPDISRKVDDDMCRLPCSDPDTELECGGNWHLAVFTVEMGETRNETYIDNGGSSNATNNSENESTDDNNNETGNFIKSTPRSIFSVSGGSPGQEDNGNNLVGLIVDPESPADVEEGRETENNGGGFSGQNALSGGDREGPTPSPADAVVAELVVDPESPEDISGEEDDGRNAGGLGGFSAQGGIGGQGGEDGSTPSPTSVNDIGVNTNIAEVVVEGAGEAPDNV